jgi:hypothetical protein
MPMKHPDPGCDTCRRQPMPADGWHVYLYPTGEKSYHRCPRWTEYEPLTPEQQFEEYRRRQDAP